MTRTELLEDLIGRFPHIPREAVLKEDLLRSGMSFDSSALSEEVGGEVKPKSYFIFSFDHKPLKELGEAATRRPPEEIALTGGPYGLRRTIVSVRTNPDSPYRVHRADDGSLGLWLTAVVVSRSHDVRGVKKAHSLATSFGDTRATRFCVHSKRAPGSKLTHWTHEWSSRPHFEHVLRDSTCASTSEPHRAQRATSW